MKDGMKNAFKILLTLIALLALTAVMAGCGKEAAAGDGKSGDEKNAEGGAKSETETDGGYIFETENETKLFADMDMKDVLKKLGEADSYYEAPGCAVDGMAKFYNYKSFEIETYPDGDTDRITRIVLKTDNAATREGIDLSMTKDDVTDAYGTDYTEAGTSYIYDKGKGTRLIFIFDGDLIESIEYTSRIVK